MPELGSYGSVRGARGNSRPYREPRPIADFGFWLLVTAALDELSSLPSDLIQRGPELGPSFVNLMELPPRFARSERDEESAAQAGHLRMIAKPTDGLLVRLAAARARNLDLGIIERASGHDASLWERPRRIACFNFGRRLPASPCLRQRLEAPRPTRLSNERLDLIQGAIPVKAPNCWTRLMSTRRERTVAIPLRRLCRGAATGSTHRAGFYPQPRHVALIAVRQAG